MFTAVVEDDDVDEEQAGPPFAQVNVLQYALSQNLPAIQALSATGSVHCWPLWHIIAGPLTVAEPLFAHVDGEQIAVLAHFASPDTHKLPEVGSTHA